MNATSKTLLTIIVGLALVGLGIYLLTGVFTSEDTQKATSTPDTATETRPSTEPKETLIGRSVEGRPIRAFTYGSGDTHLLFVGAIHGGYEWNTVILSQNLMNYIESDSSVIPEGLKVTVIPMLNPDGVHAVLGTTTDITAADAPLTKATKPGRFNANGVDLNRNFDCNWEPTSRWRSQTVDAGSSAFSEPEAQAIRDFTIENRPDAAFFFHSAADGIYGSSCNEGILAETRTIMNTYADAAGYPAVPSFDYYEITGDAEGWMAKQGIPAVSVELTTHERVEWQKNKRGIEAILKHYADQRTKTATSTIQN